MDFKNYAGELIFSEDEPWRIKTPNGYIEVKGGATTNPLTQLKRNKQAAISFTKLTLGEANNWAHISAIACFHGGKVSGFEISNPKIKSWFHICDMSNIVETIDNIASPKIALNKAQITKLLATYEAILFTPPDTKELRKIINLHSNSQTIPPPPALFSKTKCLAHLMAG